MTELTDEQIPHLIPTGNKTYDSDADMWWPTTTRQDEIRLVRVAIAQHEAQPADHVEQPLNMVEFQAVQQPVAILEHTVGGSLTYYPIPNTARNLPMGIEYKLYTAAPQPADQLDKDSEIAALKADLHDLRSGNFYQQGVISDMTNEIEALKADAERYRWLETQSGITWMSVGRLADRAAYIDADRKTVSRNRRLQEDGI